MCSGSCEHGQFVDRWSEHGQLEDRRFEHGTFTVKHFVNSNSERLYDEKSAGLRIRQVCSDNTCQHVLVTNCTHKRVTAEL